MMARKFACKSSIRHPRSSINLFGLDRQLAIARKRPLGAETSRLRLTQLSPRDEIMLGMCFVGSGRKVRRMRLACYALSVVVGGRGMPETDKFHTSNRSLPNELPECGTHEGSQALLARGSACLELPRHAFMTSLTRTKSRGGKGPVARSVIRKASR